MDIRNKIKQLFLESYSKPKSYSSMVNYTDNLIENFLEYELHENEDQRNVVINKIESNEWEESNPKEFYRSLNNSKHKEMLSDYSVSDLAKMELFKVPGIDAGFALKPMGSNNKDIVAVHNNSDIKGLGKPLMKAAIRNGGNYLDHFDVEPLNSLYSGLGFKEYKRDAYNPEYDEGGKLASKYGKVDVVYRKLDWH